MKKRLFLYTALIIGAGFLGFFGASVYAARVNNINIAKDTVKETAEICRDLYVSNTDLLTFVNAGSETRITIIAPDGAVLADSHPLDVGILENHLSRPEIQAAADDAPAAYVRHSETLGVDLIYYALKVDSGESYVFIRIAIPVAKIDAYLFQSLPLLVSLLCAIVLICFFITRRMINRIVKPFESVERKLRLLSSGEYVPGPIVGGYEEANKIVREVDEIAGVLQRSFTALRDERNKAEYILNNVGDGLFVADENKDVVLINMAALEIFGATPDIVNKNLNYLFYDKMLKGALDDCVDHAKNALFELSFNGRIYFVAVKRLPETRLTMAVLSDVTESRKNAKRREEFFANASHELKTPLTAIKGFNELAALNNKDGGIQKYIDGITRETDRMLALIGDMLKLSELENSKRLDGVPVPLAKIVDEVRESVSVAIKEKSIVFETVGDGVVMAESGHVYELVKNLIENAVRYNHQGGRVAVAIESRRKVVRFSVSDSGVGMAAEEQARVFERFYRVTKSRAQRDGGTGLGLSIVKHICALYGWKLSLKSKLGVGTEITVVFGA
ncbi:MAG: ATP-binding protein [Dehalococcoidia bacterium]|nr:ATP-binding protein [Dehalococcoidia bacterium]